MTQARDARCEDEQGVPFTRDREAGGETCIPCSRWQATCCPTCSQRGRAALAAAAIAWVASDGNASQQANQGKRGRQRHTVSGRSSSCGNANPLGSRSSGSRESRSKPASSASLCGRTVSKNGFKEMKDAACNNFYSECVSKEATRREGKNAPCFGHEGPCNHV